MKNKFKCSISLIVVLGVIALFLPYNSFASNNPSAVNQIAYTVYYYYENVLEPSATVTGVGNLGVAIPSNGKHKAGYVIDRTVNMDGIITSNPDSNVVLYYYKKSVPIPDNQTPLVPPYTGDAGLAAPLMLILLSAFAIAWLSFYRKNLKGL